MDTGLYGRFASSLHSEAQLNSRNNVVISEIKPGDIEPVQKINMDGRALGLSHGRSTFCQVSSNFKNLISINSWGSSRAGIVSISLVEFRGHAEAKMVELFTIENLFTLVVLTALETVLGFDNLLYITIEAKRVAPAQQKYVRRIGTILAIGLRIVLLFVVLQLIALFQASFFDINLPVIAGSFNGHSLIVLAGGAFLIHTALKEISHMLVVDDLEHEEGGGPKHRSVASALFWILVMNIVFSFDTVLSAVALTKNFIIMSTAIILSGVLMVALADHVANFLQRNRLYEVLGLFVLLLVGVMLLAEGGHIAHLAFFGYPVEPMAKSTFYFVVGGLVVVDIVQGRYQKKINVEEKRSKDR